MNRVFGCVLGSSLGTSSEAYCSMKMLTPMPISNFPTLNVPKWPSRAIQRPSQVATRSLGSPSEKVNGKRRSSAAPAKCRSPAVEFWGSVWGFARCRKLVRGWVLCGSLLQQLLRGAASTSKFGFNDYRILQDIVKSGKLS